MRKMGELVLHGINEYTIKRNEDKIEITIIPFTEEYLNGNEDEDIFMKMSRILIE